MSARKKRIACGSTEASTPTTFSINFIPINYNFVFNRRKVGDNSMDKAETFNILYGKEKWDVWRKFQEIENSIEESEILYKYFDDIKNMLYDEKSYIKMREFKIICRLSKWF
ncbi:MAG: hypothetical protein ACI4UE_01690 [Candidatus Scatovivens sp.]